jgi:hypothetical protein
MAQSSEVFLGEDAKDPICGGGEYSADLFLGASTNLMDSSIMSNGPPGMVRLR